MELTTLKNNILDAYKGNQSELTKILDFINRDKSVYPFNEYELLTNTLIAKKNISYNEYISIRQEYITQNPYLWIFEISAPRGFGEQFAESFILGQNPKLQKPSKKLDPKYNGQYDLWLDGIKIEVKASRVADSESSEPLYKKALSSNTKRPFLMNFQQLKPSCCDVFIWMAVYRDKITIWILNNDEVRNHPDYSIGQHRGNHGNEGQLHITNMNIKTLNKFIYKGTNIATSIKSAYKRKNTL